MKLVKILMITLLLLVAVTGCQKKAETPQETVIESNLALFETSMGNIEIELDYENAPISAKNFARYVSEGFYDNTIFHRVIPGFVIQAGGWTVDMEQKVQHAPIQNEAANGFKNLRGTLSYGRTNAPHSATSHFFINHADNPNLDYQGPQHWGYAVFGKVISGMDVVDKIATTPTTTKMAGGRQVRDVPQETMLIISAKMIAEDK
ncbi:peptidylprolyl isomerase [bacterium]|nr:peptidylprolyl isomerase [bacterium]